MGDPLVEQAGSADGGPDLRQGHFGTFERGLVARARDDQDATCGRRGALRSDQPAVADAAALRASLLREAHVLGQPQLDAALAV